MAQPEQRLIDAFVAEMPRWRESHGYGGTILQVGDSEDQLALAVRKGVVTFETVSRGHRYLEAQFAHERDGWRFMIMRVGMSWRWEKGMPSVDVRLLAPGTALDPVPSGHRLRWPAGEAIIRSEFDAMDFSWVATADPADIAASCRHVNGEPLFDLGVEPGSWPPPKPPPPRPVMPAPPIEAPPPDDLDPAALAVIDEFAALIGWARRPPAGAEVLSVGDSQVGRAISYRGSQFIYESTVDDDYRSAECAFSTVDAARRYLLLDIGTILRTRKRLRKIWPKLAPGCEMERNPKFVVLTWPGGVAMFKQGWVGQQAWTFSWLVTASLADIAASFQDPEGKPVFQLPPEPQGPVPRPIVAGTQARPEPVGPGDPELPADLVVIDDFLAKSLFWSRQPGHDPLIIEIADFDIQWVLTSGPNGYDAEYRRGGSGTVSGRFSSARGGRRFVLADLGYRWRESHGLGGFGRKQLGPGTRLEDRPDGYLLAWPGGVARFVWDYTAINFSWIATADLADIAASYIHPSGKPLFG